MLVVRNVFHLEFGKSKDAVALMKQGWRFRSKPSRAWSCRPAC